MFFSVFLFCLKGFSETLIRPFLGIVILILKSNRENEGRIL